MRAAILAVCLAGAVGIGSGCGSSAPKQTEPPPPPPITVTISPTTANVRVGEKQAFAATVSNTQITAVNWAVNGTAGGNVSVGTIDGSGNYTAPTAVPNPATVTVTATSAADATKSASATVTILPPVQVTVTPATATVVAGAKQAFQAAVTGATNAAVSWSVSGQAGGNATVGTIDASGNYTAPSAVPSPAQVMVTATSQADATASGSATVTIQAAASALAISPAAASMTLDKAAQANQAFQITLPTGFTGTVTMAASGLPPTVTASWSPSQLTGNGTMTLTLASASYSLGEQDISVTVTATAQPASGVESQKTAAVSLTITGWQGHVRTLAGIPGGIGFEDGSGTTDEMDPVAITADATSSTLYTISHHGHALRSVNLASGQVTTLAGGPYSFSIAFGSSVAWDAANQTIYATDLPTDQILAYTVGGSGLRTLASGFHFNLHAGLAMAPDGSALYLADAANQVIDRVDPTTGAVITIAGQMGVTGDNDGPAATSELAWPWGLAIDPSGKILYFDEEYSHLIRKLDLTEGTVTTLAGSPTSPVPATFSVLGGMAVDPHDGGNDLLYFTDADEIRALTLGANPAVVTIAGGEPGGFADGSGSGARFVEPSDVATIGDLSGPGVTSVFVADSSAEAGDVSNPEMNAGNGLVRRVEVANPAAVAAQTAPPEVTVTTIAGQPPHIGLVDGPGTGPPGYRDTSTALFNLPQGVSTDGKLAFIGDSGNNAVREIDLSTGAVTTVAGGHEGYQDGPALGAEFFKIGGVVYAPKANPDPLVYIADTGQGLIRVLDLTTMQVSTLAGSKGHGFADGVGTAAMFNHPWGLALSPDGATLYVADVGNNAIRKIDLTPGATFATVTTIAGGHGTGDRDGAAAQFNDPTGLALSPDGKTLYISDFNNHLIRQLDLTTMLVSTIAGQGPDHCGHQDGVGTAATLCSPALLATDGRSLYWGDSLVGVLRVMNLSTREVTTLAGTPGVLHMKDGDLSEASSGLRGPVQFNEPFGVAVAPGDTFVLIADQHANVIRILY